MIPQYQVGGELSGKLSGSGSSPVFQPQPSAALIETPAEDVPMYSQSLPNGNTEPDSTTAVPNPFQLLNAVSSSEPDVA